METTIKTKASYSILETDSASLKEIAQFVVKENYLHHAGTACTYKEETIVNKICLEEEVLTKSSHILVARDRDGILIGCVRITLWNGKDTLPIERLFGIDPSSLPINYSCSPVFHIGRLAISKENGSKHSDLLKTFMAYVAKAVLSFPYGCLIAEVDKKLFRIFGLMGISAHQIGEPIEYLASETVPMYATSEDLIDFYHRYGHLCG